MDERQKILNVVKQYRKFFSEWNADVALGYKGTNFFFVFDEEQPGYFEVFNSFATAKELEQLIISFLAGNITYYIGSAAEDMEKVFNLDVINDSYNTYDTETALKSMCRDMQYLAREYKKWSGLMEKVFRVLSDAYNPDEK